MAPIQEDHTPYVVVGFMAGVLGTSWFIAPDDGTRWIIGMTVLVAALFLLVMSRTNT